MHTDIAVAVDAVPVGAAGPLINLHALPAHHPKILLTLRHKVLVLKQRQIVVDYGGQAIDILCLQKPECRIHLAPLLANGNQILFILYTAFHYL